MLGDMVDFGFELKPGSRITKGEIIGWVEGFKAISDIYCVVEGTFSVANEGLKEKITAISKDPYASGWSVCPINQRGSMKETSRWQCCQRRVIV